MDPPPRMEVDLSPSHLEVPGSCVSAKDPVQLPKSAPASSTSLSKSVADVCISDEVLHGEEPLWKCFVVGYFMGEAPHVGKIHVTVNRIWASPGKPSKIDVQFISPTTVLFRIEDPVMRLRVLKRRYWHFSDVPLVACEWSPEMAHVKPDLSAMPLWVDLKQVLGNLFTRKGLRFLADLTGKYVKLHPNTERCTRHVCWLKLTCTNLSRNVLISKIKMELRSWFWLATLGYHLAAMFALAGVIMPKPAPLKTLQSLENI